MTRLQSRCVPILVVLLLWPLLCHTQATITNVSYGPIGVFKGAPGQVVQLWVRGLTAPTTFAGGLPLPTTLAGVTVGLRSNELGPEVLAPIFSVISPTASGTFTAFSLVTIQIPTELASGVVFPSAGYQMRINSGEYVGVALYSDNIHVLGSCWPDFCPPTVTHADGTLVRRSNPAKAGEELVIYAFGLGQTRPPVSSGTAATQPSLAGASLQFDFGMNVPPSPNPVFKPQVTPIFAGLAPGFVGLYQTCAALRCPRLSGLPWRGIESHSYYRRFEVI